MSTKETGACQNSLQGQGHQQVPFFTLSLHFDSVKKVGSICSSWLTRAAQTSTRLLDHTVPALPPRKIQPPLTMPIPALGARQRQHWNSVLQHHPHTLHDATHCRTTQESHTCTQSSHPAKKAQTQYTPRPTPAHAHSRSRHPARAALTQCTPGPSWPTPAPALAFQPKC